MVPLALRLHVQVTHTATKLIESLKRIVRYLNVASYIGTLLRSSICGQDLARLLAWKVWCSAPGAQHCWIAVFVPSPASRMSICGLNIVLF